jgi:xanthine/CO dehydrogenase XdhC/CoxF family maturation factor
MTCPIGVEGIEDKRPAAIAIAVAAQLLQRCEAQQARGTQPQAAVNRIEAPRAPRTATQ